jgi:UDP-GlcNAc:undecaprenyl-phosphate GlcNAc-1-phosphate transferase
MEYIKAYWWLLILSIFGTSILLYLFRKVAFSLNLTDKPNPRKIHRQPIPLVGGLVLFILMGFLLYFSDNITPFTFALLIASGLVVLVGVLDDIFNLSAKWRFVAQILASLIVIYLSSVQILSFGYLLLPYWDLKLHWLAIPVSVFGAVGVINALNMADGIDGLAAMTFFMPVLTLALLTNDLTMKVWLLLTLVCVLIFVLFNKSTKLKVFLGDNGSLLLGFVLAWLLVYFSQGSQAIILPVSALYFVAIAVYDTIFVMLRRIFNGKSPFKPDNSHLHHYLLLKKFSQTSVLLLLLMLSTFFIVLGLAFLHYQIPEFIQFYVFVAISIVYYFGMKNRWAVVTSV